VEREEEENCLGVVERWSGGWGEVERGVVGREEVENWPGQAVKTVLGKVERG
jgi:hypothetical protein